MSVPRHIQHQDMNGAASIWLRTHGTLGLYEAENVDTPLLTGGKPLAILAYIALLPGRECTRDHLAALFWPGGGAQARHSLRQALYQLNQVLDGTPMIRASDATVQVTACVVLDCVEAEHAIRRGDLERAIELLDGEFLPGISVEKSQEFESWLESQRIRFGKLWYEAALQLAKQVLGVGDVERAVELGQQLCRHRPYDTEPVHLLMRARAQSGQFAEALALYDAYAESLRRDLAEEADPELRSYADELESRMRMPTSEGLDPRDSAKLGERIRTLLRIWSWRRSERVTLLCVLVGMAVGIALLTLDVENPLWTRIAVVSIIVAVSGLIVIQTKRLRRRTGRPRFTTGEFGPVALKGPTAFTARDGRLFRELGREPETSELLEHIMNPDVPLIVIMGASGAGKTSLLRAGLCWNLRHMRVPVAYWEARADRPVADLAVTLKALLPPRRGHESNEQLSLVEELNLGVEAGRAVIVFDQLEQLDPECPSHKPVFGMLRDAALRGPGSHLTTFVVAFRREFDPVWRDFELELGGHHPPFISLRGFPEGQAIAIMRTLAKGSGLELGDKVMRDFLGSVARHGRVSPVDIGVGLAVLHDLSMRQGDDRIDLGSYRLAGGSVGLMTLYIQDRLERFDERDRNRIFQVLLQLIDEQAERRISDGLSQESLAAATGVGVDWMVSRLSYLASPAVRILERLPARDEEATRFRLAHEEFIPSIRRLAGHTLARVDEARIVLETAYRPWQITGQSQYLLRGAALRQVVEHLDRVKGSGDGDRVKEFVRLSQRRRTRLRVFWSVAVVALAVLAISGLRYINEAKVLVDAEVSSRELASAALRQLPRDPQLGLHLALAAMRNAKTSAALEALHQTLHVSVPRLEFAAHQGAAIAIAFDNGGDRFVSGGSDGAAKVWNSRTGELSLLLLGHDDEIVTVAYESSGERIATGGLDGTARIWNARSGELEAVLRVGPAGVSSVGFAAMADWVAVGTFDGRVLLWNSLDGSTQTLLSQPSAGRMVISPDRSNPLLASGGGDGLAFLWDLLSGRQVRTFQHGGPILDVVLASGSQLVTASQDGSTKIWNPETGELRTALSTTGDPVRAAAFSYGLAWLATTSGASVTIWNPRAGTTRTELIGHRGWVWDVAFRPGGHELLSTSSNGVIRSWEPLATGAYTPLSGHRDGVMSVAYSPDGSLIATASLDSTAAIWDAQTGRQILTLRGHQDHVRSVGFYPVGQRIVTGGQDGIAIVWDASNGKQVFTLRGHADRVADIAFDPAGRFVVTASKDGTARIWDARTGASVRTLSGHGDQVRAVAVSPNGSTIATVGYDHAIKTWDAESGQAIMSFTGHDRGIEDVAFSPDGAQLATGSLDGTVRLWDPSSGKERAILHGHSHYVFDVLFGPSGERLYSASADRTVRVWDIATGREELVLAGQQGAIMALALAPDGKRLASSSMDGTVQIHAVDTEELMRVATSRLRRDLTPDECERFVVKPCPKRNER